MRDRLLSPRLWLPLLALAASGYIGYYIIGRGSFSEQQLVFLVLGLGLGGGWLYALTIPQEHLLTQALVWLPLLWLVGVRGADLYGSVEVFMPQVALYGLAVTLLVRRVINGQAPRLWHSPIEVGILVITAIGAVSALLYSQRLDIWLQDVLSLGSVWAAFFCLYELKIQIADIKRLFIIAACVMALITLSGLLEMFLGVGQVAYVPLDENFTTAIQPEDAFFFRVSYFYWGGYVASTLILLALPLTLALLNLAPTWRQKRWVYVLMGLTVLGVAVSGYRGLWIAMLTIIGLSFLFNRQGAGWSLVVAGAIVIFAPISYYTRFLSIFSRVTDSSAIDRFERIRYAWELTLQNPLIGGGWGSSGWVHNDLAQIAADAGLPAALGFIALILWLAYQLLRAPDRWPWLLQPENAEWRWLAFGAGLALVASLLAMFTQTFIVTPIVMSFFALLLAVANRLWDMLKSSEELTVNSE